LGRQAPEGGLGEVSIRGVPRAARSAAQRVSTIVRLERELATLELKHKLQQLGLGAGLVALAAFIALLGLVFLIVTITALLALALPWWAALLIVTVVLFLVAAGLGWFGLQRLKAGSPPVPAQAIEEARRTQAVLRQ
jgi:uncharacterized membrane protein YqjE